jgi:glycosyltransferase involved in cell wall biosynthesis
MTERSMRGESLSGNPGEIRPKRVVMTQIQPKITVVTPSYNQGQYLERTITSVLSQSYEPLEYIVLDGGSSDGSVDIIKAYSRHLAHWESRADDGQAAAIKHGMELATGEVVCWLNSDDMLLPDALAEVARQYHLSDWLLLAGRTAIIDEHDRPTNLQVPMDRSIESMLTWGHGVAQMSTFYRSSAIAEIGGVDASLSFAFDFDLFVRLRRYGRFQFTDRYLAAARLHSATKSSRIPEVGRQESYLISHKYTSLPFLNNLRSFTRQHDIFFHLRNHVAWKMGKQSVIDAISQAIAQGEEEAEHLCDQSGNRRRDVCGIR